MTETELRHFFRNDRFAAHVGIELLEAGPGRARARLTLDDRHLNAVGLGHGAAIFSLADLVFAVASNSHGQVALGVNVSVSFLRAARAGATLVAAAEEVSINPRLATYLIRIAEEDASGDTDGTTAQLIAIFQGTVYRKRETLDEALSERCDPLP